MRSSIGIDEALLDAAMEAGPFSTKKAAVGAGFRLLAKQASYRELLALEGKLMWDDDAKDGDLLLKMRAPGAAES